MRFAILALALAGCTLTPGEQKIVSVACKLDAVAQTVVVAVAPTVVPATSPAVSLDQALVHPAVVAACAQFGGTPVAVAAVPVAPAAQ
jgi:hypothetical protein